MLNAAALLGAAALAALALGCGAPYQDASPAVAAPAPPLVIIVVSSPRLAHAVEEEAPAEVAALPAPAEAPAPEAAPLERPPAPPPEVPLSPRWRGTWEDPQGFRYQFDLALQEPGKGRVEGQFTWRLLAAPPGSPHALRIDQTGKELVRGTYDARRRRLDLAGYGVSNPILLAADQYHLVVDGDGRGLSGHSLGSSDAWTSRLQARAVP